ncbi:trafficking protein particle complex subunit 2-like protein [Podospora australis]|uniref:Trafficking protein particle complex subunit 2-like protein n=1 Tax=Podospora australis TaxID=1536484 RepID=A0AAN7AMQ4_9PEZI|nr:trafficking protein particle complex subunit 2-like protein [Podospora australis]
MATCFPSIACLGVIGRNNNPLHVSIFPSYDPATNSYRPVRTPLQFSLLLSSTLDVFELRSRQNVAAGTGLTGDFGLLHAVDERLAAYGFETNTGVRFVVIVDMRGRIGSGPTGRTTTAGDGGKTPATPASAAAAGVGLREGEMKVVFKAMQAAYIRLLQNPFFDPDEHSPPGGHGGRKITSRKFGEDMRRIGEGWTAGVTSL